MPLFKRMQIWIRVLWAWVATFGGVKCCILNAEHTVEQILANKKSLIRFGDGEFGIYQGKSIHYQKWSAQLKKDFDQIKEEYSQSCETAPYLLAVPEYFMTINGIQLARKRVYVSSWAESRLNFKKNFRNDIPYGDAFLFEKGNGEIYSKLWTSEQCPENIIFVHNAKEYADVFAQKYRKKVFYIQCPPQNAFEAIEELENKINKTIEQNHLNSDNVQLVISAGPAGKVLVYRFSHKHYWCIDAGHCWDDPLET